MRAERSLSVGRWSAATVVVAALRAGQSPVRETRTEGRVMAAITDVLAI